MAENSMQNQKNEVSFVLSEQAKAIIDSFEQKLYESNYTAEDKNSIRAESVWQMFYKQYPETVGKIEEIMSAAESKRQAMELLDKKRIQDDAWIDGLVMLHPIRKQIPICDLVDAKQMEVLIAETPAVVDYYYYAIVDHDVFNGFADMYPELCINLSSEGRTIRVLCVKDNISLEEPLHNFKYPLYFILYYFKNNSPKFSVLNDKFESIIIDENKDVWNDRAFKHDDVSHLLQEIAAKHLSDTGNLFYRSAASSINDDSLLAFRKWIVGNKFLHGVIQLGTGMDSEESEEQVLVISKRPANSVYFVDARTHIWFADEPKDFVKDGKLVVDKLTETIREKTASSYFTEMSFDEFVSHNHKYYTFINRAKLEIPTPKEGEVLVPLKDLIDLCEPETEDFVSCYFLNRPYYFKNDYWDNLEAVEMTKARRVPNEKLFLFRWDEFSGEFSCAYHSIIDDSLFIDVDTSTGVSRPYDYYNNRPIVCTYPNSIVFKLKENPACPIDPYYLAKLFHPSNEVPSETYAQLQCYRLAFPNHHLDIEDFLSIVVAIPSMEEQLRILNLDRQKALADTKKVIKKSFEAYKQDIRMKKHALAQRLATMNNWWKTLLIAREEGNGIVDDKAVVGQLHPVAVKNIYTQIGHEINMLFKQLNSFNLGDAIDNKEIFDATAFVQEYVKHHDPMFEYQCALPDKPANIRFPKEAFQIILDNISSNACSHGFKGREKEKNIIRIIAEIKGQDLIIRVDNNGKPMPVGMTAEKVFTYGDTTEEGSDEHGGLGCYQIKDLMTKFGGEVELELNPEAGFPVAYKLVFRDVNIYK